MFPTVCARTLLTKDSTELARHVLGTHTAQRKVSPRPVRVWKEKNLIKFREQIITVFLASNFFDFSKKIEKMNKGVKLHRISALQGDTKFETNATLPSQWPMAKIVCWNHLSREKPAMFNQGTNKPRVFKKPVFCFPVW